MLVLSRRLKEVIVLRDARTGEETRVTVTEIDRGKVRLGVSAPASVSIWREEIAPPHEHGGES